MKANELMIGDWVIVYEKAMPVKARVEGVFGRGAMVLGHVRSADHGFMEPIPLTQEILEKNGFRKLVTYGTEKWLCNNLRLNVYSSDGTWRFCADTNRNEDSVIYVRFVHQLQNALLLCGIEKEITI